MSSVRSGVVKTFRCTTYREKIGLQSVFPTYRPDCWCPVAARAHACAAGSPRISHSCRVSCNCGNLLRGYLAFSFCFPQLTPCNFLHRLWAPVLLRCSDGTMVFVWQTKIAGSGRTTLFLRKAAASSLEHRLARRLRSLRCRVLVCHAADTASLATWFLFGKLLRVATLFDFGEKRCRKNLPLGGTARKVTLNDT